MLCLWLNWIKCWISVPEITGSNFLMFSVLKLCLLQKSEKILLHLLLKIKFFGNPEVSFGIALKNEGVPPSNELRFE